jgi:hypothetical protein
MHIFLHFDDPAAIYTRIHVAAKNFTTNCLRHIILFDIFHVLYKLQWAGLAQSVERLPTGWTVRGSNPGGGEIFRTCPDRPWGPPSLLYDGYRVFPGCKVRPGRDSDPSPPSSAEVKNRVELYLYSP